MLCARSVSICSAEQVGLGLEVVVVVLRDRQQLHAVALELCDRRQQVVGGEGDVLHARAEQLAQEARRLRARALRGVEHEAQRCRRPPRSPGCAPARPDRRPPAPALSRDRAARCRTAASSASRRTASIARCGRPCVQAGLVRRQLRRSARTRCPRRGRGRSSGRGSRSGCRRRRAPPGCRARPAPTAWWNGWSSSRVARSNVAAASSTREPERADRRAVHEVEGMGEALLLAVDHEVDVALAPSRHRLGAVLAGAAEAEARQQRLRAAARPDRRRRTR